MENATLIKVNDLVVEYAADKKTVQAVNGVYFELRKGETLGLVGETGAGKTTIAKAILGILPDPPAKVRKGEIEFDGQDLLKLSGKKMSHIKGNEISMIFQDPMTALNPIMTVGKQISETIRLHNKMSKAEAGVEAVKMLELVGIPGERYNEYPHQFSGGMKQRVVIAMALACKPKLLLADEPTTALDVTIQAQVLDMMNNLKQELGTSVLLITMTWVWWRKCATGWQSCMPGKSWKSGRRKMCLTVPRIHTRKDCSNRSRHWNRQRSG